MKTSLATLTIGRCTMYTTATLLTAFLQYTIALPYTLFGVHALVLLMGPLLVVLDMHAPMNTTRRAHHGETIVRAGILVWLYAMVLPEAPFFSVSSSLPASYISAVYVGSLLHFMDIMALYVALVFSLHRFAILPRWLLLYGPLSHVSGFVLLMVLSILELELGITHPFRGFGLWLLGASTVVMLLVWRHALWYNASQRMPPAQQTDVWPRLEKKEAFETFWASVYMYNLRYPDAVTGATLSCLNLTALLLYFDNRVIRLSDPTAPDFLGERIKAAITAKEQRAAFIWELYSTEDAVYHIANIDNIAARAQTTTIELPTL